MNNDQVILGCDEQGNFSGEYMPRMEGHTGTGKRHIGITILLVNNKEEVLLQKRKHMVFDNVWCFSADTHPLHKTDGTDETIEEAAKRCLRVEYDIRSGMDFNRLGSYDYAAVDGKLCENEHCLLLVGKYDGELHLNPLVGYEYRWLSKVDFLKDFQQNPAQYAPWVKGGLDILKEKNFF